MTSSFIKHPNGAGRNQSVLYERMFSPDGGGLLIDETSALEISLIVMETKVGSFFIG